MVSKKLILSLGLGLFGLIYCTNAEQEALDSKQDPRVDIDSVPFCKIHHGDSPELESLNIVDILREVWKDGGFDCDKVLNGADKIKNCKCTVIIKNCGCRVLDMCEEHHIRLDNLIESKLRAIRGIDSISDDNHGEEPECLMEFCNDVDFSDIDLNDVESSEYGEPCFDSGIIGIADVNLDEDMSNLDPYGVYTRD